ncbi:MAG: glycosyltransferase family 2 protein [Planctomycetes bacterium]|nr:glycosyltransferase family 2 protein [Planctomycetota bacterium]
MRPSVSVCIVTFNEEANIGRCLESVKWAEEIIVVDSFSTDKTVEIAGQFNARVTQRAWPGHIEQKTYALSLAKNEWVLCLDADEVVTDSLKDEMFRRLEQDAGKVDGYCVKRHTFYLNRWINHGGWYPDYKLRLFKKSKGYIAGVNPHDRYFINGAAVRLNGDMIHYTYRDIAHQLRTIDSFSNISAEQLMKQGRKSALIPMIVKPPLKFLETYVYKLGFMDGMAGLIISVLTSYYVFLKYAKLWEKTNIKSF